MGFAGAAAATTLTSPTGTAATPTIKAENEGGHVILHNPNWKLECSSTFEGKLERHGTGVTAGGKLSSLSFSNCTNSWHTTVNVPGSFEIHHASGYNGTLTWSGGTWTATRFGIECRYATNTTKWEPSQVGRHLHFTSKQRSRFTAAAVFAAKGQRLLQGLTN
jgi:hypothetical protein